MKPVNIVFLMMNVMAGFAAVSGWTSVEDLEAAKVRTQRRLQEHLRRLEDHERHHQELLEAMKMTDEGHDKDTKVLEELERISRSSTSDLRFLKEHLEWHSHKGLREAQNGLDNEKEKEALLRQRWWRAKHQVRRAKHEHDAVDRASLRQAEATAKVIDAAMEEAEYFRGVQRQLDLRTQKVLAQKEKKRNEGTLKRWRHRLYSVFRWTSKATTEHVDTPQATGPAPVDIPQQGTVPLEDYIGVKQEESEGPVQENSEGPVEEDSEGPVEKDSEGPVEEDSEGAVQEDSEGPVEEDSEGPVEEDSEGPVQEDSEGPVQEDSEGPVQENSEGPVQEDSEGPVQEDSEGLVQENSEGPAQEDSEGPVQEDSEGPVQEDSKGPVQEDSEGPVQENSEGPVQEDSEGPAQEDSEGPVPQDLRQGRRRRPFMWLVYLHLAVSLAVAGIRIHDRLRVKRRRDYN